MYITDFSEAVKTIRRFYIIMKRIIALLLCLATILCVFVACGEDEKDNKKKEEVDLGQEIRVYITEPIYNFDPAYAYGNESAFPRGHRKGCAL